ncbi:MAG: 1-acyl-sn-glycerol-3-phosphate acyltransferase [Rhizobiales bacterium]|nr:1-acyl-sn-glycerol-3-phosphate acyltransferase [Hyphomicrobiales bacterium]
MNSIVQLPFWLVVTVFILASLFVVMHLIIPGIRWMFRRKIKKVMHDVDDRLRLKLPRFQLTKREVLIDRLTFDLEVMEVAQKVADERGVTYDEVNAEVAAYAREMVPSFNPFIYFRLGYRLARWFIRAFYRVRLGFIHKNSLGTFPKTTSVVFVSNHRSNLDYLLVTYLASQDTAMSYGAGEWARIWPFSLALRSAGAYIVRRNLDDEIYRKMLQRYVQMATVGGVPHGIFIEGQLSRNGMVNDPRLGLIGYITRTLEPDENRDIVFIPIGINYDRVVEERTLVENAETDFRGSSSFFVLGSTLRFIGSQIWRKLTGRRIGFGMACANFGDPISLRAWSKARNIDFSSIEKPEFFKAVETLGDEIMGRIEEIIPVLAVPLLSTVLLEHKEAISDDILLTEAKKIALELRTKGAHIGIEKDGIETGLANGLQLMKRRSLLENDEAGLLSIVSEETALLQYYANSIIQLRSRLCKTS